MAATDHCFYDGRTARAQPVTVDVGARDLVARTADGAIVAHWPFDSLVRQNRIGEAELWLGSTRAPEARLVIRDRAVIDALARRLPSLGRRDALGGRALASLGLAVVAFVAVIALAIDRGPRWIAPYIPDEWLAPIGDSLAESLAEGGVCRYGQGTAALDDLMARLSAAAGLAMPVEIAVLNRREANALALPGGRVLLLRGLIDAADGPDAVAGVLAHEVAHVAHRHPTVGVVRQLGLMAILRLVVGGSGEVETLAGMGNLLLALSYSREAEAEADATGLATMAELGIDPRPMARLLDEIARKHGGDALPAWLSTHPQSAARRAALEAAAGAGPYRPALDPDQWRAVKGVCAVRE